MRARSSLTVLNNIYSVLGKRIKRKNIRTCRVNASPLVTASAKSPWSSLEVKVFIPAFPADFRISSENGGVTTVSIDERTTNNIFLLLTKIYPLRTTLYKKGVNRSLGNMLVEMKTYSGKFYSVWLIPGLFSVECRQYSATALVLPHPPLLVV